MDPELFEELLGEATANPETPVEAPPQAGAPVKPPMEPGLGNPTSFLDAAVGGAAQAVVETKDFIFGNTPDAEKSEGRKNLEGGVKKLSEESVVDGFVAGVSQFATGMIGLGKLQKGLQALGWAGTAARGTKAALEVGKAATVGAVAFDPHAERLSNLVERFPALSNPVSRYLAADPTDSAAEGRLKNAMESIGLDAALMGVFVAGTKAARAFKRGNKEEIEAATEELAQAVDQSVAQPVEAPGPLADELVTPAPAADVAVPEVPAVEAPRDILDLGSPSAPQIEVTQGGPLADTPTGPDLPPVPDDQLATILSGARADADALATHGSWEAAVGNGHVFGRGGSIPWQKITEGPEPSTGVDAFIARVAETLKDPLDAAKGGDVLSDPQVTRMVNQRANLWGEDPAATLGLLQQAGEDARTMAANMEASFLVAQRATQDAYAMSARINAGYLDEFGGDREAALTAFKQMVSVMVSAQGSAQSMRAAAGRSMRRLRGDFKFSQADVDALQSLDGEQLVKLMASTEGDPRAIAKVMNPSMWKRGTDAAQWLLVNNLLWGWKTHAVNLLTNTYMVVGRPMERILGSVAIGGETGARVRAESARQYAYMGSSLIDSWKVAVETWRLGDSVLAPHTAENLNVGGNIGKTVAQMPFKPWDSLPNILHNAIMVGGAKTLGAPTRMLGTVDEMVKQVVYRSKVMARAHVEGQASGLEGADLSNYVRDKLYDAFDDSGRAVDMNAMKEAQVATFQQDLLTGTFGKSTQIWVQNHQALRFILPFVKTPTNVIRMGQKMTPGLNMLQQEYRKMIRGEMGRRGSIEAAEAQAQAVGEMAMGSLFMGTAFYLASSGYITGGGPSDPRHKSALMATGWQPYSFVVANPDGTRTYVPYGRFDPVAMPFGIVADLTDIMHQVEEGDDLFTKAEAAGTGLLVSISKQLANKTYLLSVNQAMEAIMDPDRSAARFLGQTASNFIPMATALRFSNPDPHLRDARGIVDKMLATVPGLSETVPARYDVWGEPLTVNKGLWVSGDRDVVDAEVRRMIEEKGLSMGPPSPTIDGLDLRDVTMVDGRNAYEVYQQTAGKPTPRSRSLKDTVAKLMATPAYGRAVDGGSSEKGTKLYMLEGTIKKYRAVALQRLKADRNVREAMMRKGQEVRSALAAKRMQEEPRPAQASGLPAIGQAFGVDLNGLLQQQ